mmetsp:Transcript_41358/g.103223  ORF Transcript_41358/g.103223 Transcript_41358/m.103223 type:complete len:337 (+) Transcript_41358:244-1254(+)
MLSIATERRYLSTLMERTSTRIESAEPSRCSPYGSGAARRPVWMAVWRAVGVPHEHLPGRLVVDKLLDELYRGRAARLLEHLGHHLLARELLEVIRVEEGLDGSVLLDDLVSRHGTYAWEFLCVVASAQDAKVYELLHAKTHGIQQLLALDVHQPQGRLHVTKHRRSTEYECIDVIRHDHIRVAAALPHTLLLSVEVRPSDIAPLLAERIYHLLHIILLEMYSLVVHHRILDSILRGLVIGPLSHDGHRLPLGVIRTQHRAQPVLLPLPPRMVPLALHVQVAAAFSLVAALLLEKIRWGNQMLSEFGQLRSELLRAFVQIPVAGVGKSVEEASAID